MSKRSISLQIASASPDTARQLLEQAIVFYEQGVVNEDGKLLTGPPGDGCAMMYLWSEEDR